MQQWSGEWLWELACAHCGSDRPCLACAAAVSGDTVNKKVSQMFLHASLASSSAWAESITEAWTFRHKGVYSCFFFLLLFLFGRFVFLRWMLGEVEKDDWRRRWGRLLLIQKWGNLSLNFTKDSWKNSKRTLLRCCRVTGRLIVCVFFKFGISTHVSTLQLLCACNAFVQRQYITYFFKLYTFFISMTFLENNYLMMTSWWQYIMNLWFPIVNLWLCKNSIYMTWVNTHVSTQKGNEMHVSITCKRYILPCMHSVVCLCVIIVHRCESCQR